MAIITVTSMASGVSTDTFDCDEEEVGRGTGSGGGCRNDGSHEVMDGSRGTGGSVGTGAGTDCVVLTVVALEFGVDDRVDDRLDDSVVGVIGRMNIADNGLMFPHFPTTTAPFPASFI